MCADCDPQCYACLVGVWTGPESHNPCCPVRSSPPLNWDDPASIPVTKLVKVRTKECPKCGDYAVLEVSAEGLKLLNEGAFIQQAFPELSLDERERFISGFCPRCWAEIFADEDEDEGIDE